MTYPGLVAVARVFCAGLLALGLAALVVALTSARTHAPRLAQTSGFVSIGTAHAFILGVTAHLNADGTCTVVSVAGSSGPAQTTRIPCPEEQARR